MPDRSEVEHFPQGRPPIPERVPPPVFQYRGQEQHGVPAETRGDVDAAREDEQWSQDGRPVWVREEEPQPEPVAVRIVNTSGEKIPRWNGYTTTITQGDVPTMLVGRDNARTSLTIANDGPDTIYLAPVPQTNPAMSGVRLDDGESWNLGNGAEVYAFIPASALTTGASVRVQMEWTAEV